LQTSCSENIVKHYKYKSHFRVKAKSPLENPGNLAENPLKIPGKYFILLLAILT